MADTRKELTAKEKREFPYEIFLYIFAFLANKPEQLHILRLVCSTWRSVASDNFLWRKYCKKQFIDRLPAGGSIFTLYANIHARGDTFYCLGSLAELNENIMPSIKRSFTERNEYMTFNTREEAIHYAEELKSCRVEFRTNFNNKLDSFPFIFVVKLRKSPPRTRTCNINNTDYVYGTAETDDVVRIYEVIYKTHKNTPVQVYQFPPHQQRSLIPVDKFIQHKCTLI